MKISKRNWYIIIGIAAIILISAIVYFKPFKKEAEQKKELFWFVDTNGYLYYTPNRGQVKFRRDDHSETENLTVSKIIYQSREGNVYGLLVLPKSADDLMPGIVLLPGAGVGKESELPLALKIAELGAAVLVIDQRGVGETNGILPTLDEDFQRFLEGTEPYQYLMVYDALRGYDLLYSAPFIDPDRIMIAGESLGGRIAVIAAAIENRIKGALVISSSGFDFQPKGDKGKDIFIQSIDSDHYMDLIAPRKLVMIHNVNDSIIPLSSAVRSFSKAQEPKQFVLINNTSCKHGYCDAMYDGLVDALDYIVQIRTKTLVSVPG